MKNNLLLLLTIFFCDLITLAQTTSFEAEITTGENYCREYVKVTVHNTGPLNEDLRITVYKYGQIIESSFYALNQILNVNGNSSAEVILNYSINEIKNRNIIVHVENASTETAVGPNITISVPADYSLGFGCGFSDILSEMQTLEYGEQIFFYLNDVPLDAISAVDTVTLLPDENGFYHGFNIYDAQYVKINPVWLDHNNLAQISPDSIRLFFWNDSTSLNPIPNLGSEPIYDALELGCNGCNFLKIKTENSFIGSEYQNVVYDFTNSTGVVNTFIATGDFQIFINENVGPYTFSINQQWLDANGLQSSSSDFIVNFGSSNTLQFTQQVECAANAEIDYYFSYVVPNSFFSVEEYGSVSLNVCNFNCAEVGVYQTIISLVYPSILTPILSDLAQYNPIIDGDSLILHVDLNHYCELIQIPFSFPGNTPAETVLDFTAIVRDPLGGENNTTNNSELFSAIVLNSSDPNFKNCDLPLYINANEVDTLKYDIHFQNEGNYMAIKVVIKDTISEYLDLSSFRLLGSKHPVSYSINPINRVITFTFDNIFLVPKSENENESQGFVIYSIEENENLLVNTEINNTAHIYFDFNEAIITNTTQNINSFLGINNSDVNIIQIYPNPVKDILHIDAENLIQVEIFDLTGKILIKSGNQSEISTLSLSEGVYLVAITSEFGEYLRKVIIKR